MTLCKTVLIYRTASLPRFRVWAWVASAPVSRVASRARGREKNREKQRVTKPHRTFAVAHLLCIITSLQTRLLPNTTCSPSKKLSPNMVTEAPPWVHPSLGVMCFMHGVATGRGENIPAKRIELNCPSSFTTQIISIRRSIETE